MARRSIVGVGITPPKVLGTPKPASSVMISSTFGAPFGGTTRGAHQGLDCSASFLMTPPNFGSGGGSCLPLMVVVALGEPSVPVTCCASTCAVPRKATTTAAPNAVFRNLMVDSKKCGLGWPGFLTLAHFARGSAASIANAFIRPFLGI